MSRYQPVFENLLSPEETQRAHSFRFERDREHFIVRRVILRRLLARYMRTEPGRITYRTNRYGKLSLESGPIRFNCSHSQDWGVIALTLEHEIGVDLEKTDLPGEYLQIAERYFSAREFEELRLLPSGSQADAFFHVWTQKEAFIKASGEGLSHPLKDFSVSTNPSRPGGLLWLKDGDVSAWRMVTREPMEGWRLAVCVKTELPLDMQVFQPGMQEFDAWFTAQSAPGDRIGM